MTAPGWYYADGDPPQTQRYWDGERWIGDPQYPSQQAKVGSAPLAMAGGATPNRHRRPAEQVHT